VPSNFSSFSLTSRRIRSGALMVCAASLGFPSNRSASRSARNSWKSSMMPVCGVAVISSRCRATEPAKRPSLYTGVEVAGAQHLYVDAGCIRRLHTRAGRRRSKHAAGAAEARQDTEQRRFVVRDASELGHPQQDRCPRAPADFGHASAYTKWSPPAPTCTARHRPLTQNQAQKKNSHATT